MRKTLQNRRANETFTVESGGAKYTATISRFEDGRVAEIFLNGHKSGSEADVNACDAAVVTSIALQYGAPVEVIRHALKRNVDGTPSGALAAALDYVSKIASTT